MPDPILILQGTIAAAIIAVAGYFAIRRLPIVGMLFGVLAGVAIIGLFPRFPPREDQDRLLLALLPTLALVEVIGVFLPRIVWVFRGLIAAVTARVVLHGSIYLMEWTSTEATAFVLGVGVLLGAIWFALAWTPARRSAILALGIANFGAGLAIMMSGYATGGQIALPIVAVLFAVSIFPTERLESAIGFGIVSLFAILISGRFFGNLTTLNAGLLAVSPVIVTIGRWWWLRMTLSIVPIVVAVGLAHQKFEADSHPAKSSPGEWSAEDYSIYK